MILCDLDKIGATSDQKLKFNIFQYCQMSIIPLSNQQSLTAVVNVLPNNFFPQVESFLSAAETAQIKFLAQKKMLHICETNQKKLSSMWLPKLNSDFHLLRLPVEDGILKEGPTLWSSRVPTLCLNHLSFKMQNCRLQHACTSPKQNYKTLYNSTGELIAAKISPV